MTGVQDVQNKLAFEEAEINPQCLSHKVLKRHLIQYILV